MNKNNYDTELVNFCWRIGKQQHRFDLHYGKDIENNQFYYNIFTPSWLYESKNKFIHIILRELDPKEYIELGLCRQLEKFNSLLEVITSTSGKEIYIKTLNELPFKGFTGLLNHNFVYKNKSNENTLYKLIFWWLVALALDNELYDKYLDYVVDASDIFGFTEDMISDWCNAVVYWLNGNDIDNNCNLNFKSDEANKFFKI